jgi:hypothetical protein
MHVRYYHYHHLGYMNVVALLVFSIFLYIQGLVGPKGLEISFAKKRIGNIFVMHDTVLVDKGLGLFDLIVTTSKSVIHACAYCWRFGTDRVKTVHIELMKSTCWFYSGPLHQSSKMMTWNEGQHRLVVSFSTDISIFHSGSGTHQTLTGLCRCLPRCREPKDSQSIGWDPCSVVSRLIIQLVDA